MHPPLKFKLPESVTASANQQHNKINMKLIMQAIAEKLIRF